MCAVVVGTGFAIIADEPDKAKSNQTYHYNMKRNLLAIGLVAVTMGAVAQNKAKEPVVLISTSMGDIKVKLYNETPKHRDNFLEIVRTGKFDGSIFHRVIKDFMIQGGGSDGGLNTIDNRPMVDAEIMPALYHKKGAMAAARTGDNVNPKRMSSGSQFYIVQGRTFQRPQLQQMAQRGGFTYTEEQLKMYETVGGTPHLDMQYTVFGEVIEGLDVVDKIAAVQTKPGDRPVTDITMKATLVK